MSSFLAEFIGTFILIVFGCGVCAGTTLQGSYSKGAGWVVISFAWGLAVTMAVFAAGSVSGAHINPAVTVSLAATGTFPWADVPAYILAQMLGAMTGATVVWLHYLPHWGKTPNIGEKLGVFCTGPAIPSRWANLLSEIIGTFILLLGLMFIGSNEYAQGLNPLVVGGLVVVIGMSLGGTTGYAINPARDLGPRLAHFLLPVQGKGTSNWGYAWVPVVGPLLGGAMGAFFYNAIANGQTGAGLWLCSAGTIGVVVLAVVENIRGKN